jgi:hypothetical protein
MRRFTVAMSTAMALASLMAGVVKAQSPENYLDVFICKVKPEKRADFDSVGKKIADANRRLKGDTFLALETDYGEQNTVMFVSQRENYASIVKAGTAMMAAMKEAYGPAAPQMFQDVNKCLISSRTELRRRRWDLSFNVPSDPAAVAKALGESRVLRTLAIHVRPGRTEEFEAQLKALKAAREKVAGPMTLISEAVAGQHGAVFYVSALRNSLADFDNAPTPLRQLLGESGYEQFQKSTAENVLSSETTMYHFVPELSSAPKQVADAAPEFWNPKPAAGSRSRTKPKPTEQPKPAQ